MFGKGNCGHGFGHGGRGIGGAFAFGGFGGFGGPGRLLAGLDLSDDQVDKLAGIKAQRIQGIMQGMGGKLVGRFRELGQLLAQPTLDKDKARALFKELQAEKNAIGEQVFESILAAVEVLTPEQRKAVRTRMQRKLLGLGCEERSEG